MTTLRSLSNTQTYLQVIQTLAIVFGLQVELREREDDAEVSGDGYGDGGPEVIGIQQRGGALVPRGGEGPRTGVQFGVLWVCGGKKTHFHLSWISQLFLTFKAPFDDM